MPCERTHVQYVKIWSVNSVLKCTNDMRFESFDGSRTISVVLRACCQPRNRDSDREESFLYGTQHTSAVRISNSYRTTLAMQFNWCHLSSAIYHIPSFVLHLSALNWIALQFPSQRLLKRQAPFIVNSVKSEGQSVLTAYSGHIHHIVYHTFVKRRPYLIKRQLIYKDWFQGWQIDAFWR